MSYKSVTLDKVFPSKKDKYETFEVYYGAVRNKIKYSVGSEEPEAEIKTAIENIYNIDHAQYSDGIKGLKISYYAFKKIAGHINFVLPPSTTPASDLSIMIDIYKRKTSIICNCIYDEFNATKTAAEMEESEERLINDSEAIEKISAQVKKLILADMGYKYDYTIRIRRYVDMITSYDAIKEDLIKTINDKIRSRKATAERIIDANITCMFAEDRIKNIRNHKVANNIRL